MSKSTDFLDLIMNKRILNTIKLLLNLPKNNNFLINSNTIRMDTPGINKYTYGWHKDENTNIPGSNFVQLWAPLFNKVTKFNGAMEVALKSHLINVKTNKTYSERKKLGKDNRSSYNNTFIIKDKFKKKFIVMNVGEVLLFKKNLIHRSGLAKNKSMRYACTCFYHNINDESFRYYKIDRK
jgi:ectoine hydroxylase-related dioxygenase (phytanoyl-CoA dioxygenase family)